MAGNAGHRDTAVPSSNGPCVAFITGGRNMGAKQRKPRLVMKLTYACNVPGTRSVAPGAISSKFSKVRVGVACGARRVDCRKFHSMMTGSARNSPMLPFEGKSRGRVAERCVGPHFP